MIRILILTLALVACTDTQATMPDAGLPACSAVCDLPSEPRLCTRAQVCSCQAADGSGEISCQGELHSFPDAGTDAP